MLIFAAENATTENVKVIRYIREYKFELVGVANSKLIEIRYQLTNLAYEGR